MKKLTQEETQSYSKIYMVQSNFNGSNTFEAKSNFNGSNTFEAMKISSR